MKQRLITVFYDNPRLLILALLLIIIAGMSAWSILPRLEDPFIINRFAVVITQFPGATAERVESQITEKVEDDLQAQSEVKEINSVSRPGISVVTLELKDEITDTDPVWTKLRDRLNKISADFPSGAGVPVLDEERSYAFTQLIAIMAPRGRVPLYTLKRYAKALQRDCQRLLGTDYARLFGAPQEEIQVAVEGQKLRALGLTLQEVADKVRAADSKSPAGSIDHPLRQYNLEIKGEFLNLNRIRQIPIGTDKNGELVRVKDIAKVSQGLQEPPAELAIVNGEPAVVVAVRILPDQKIDRWAAQIHTIMLHFQKTLPQPLQAKEIFNQQRYTDLRLRNLGLSLLLGTFLVVFSIVLTIGWRASIAVTLTLPLSILMSLFLLNIFDISIHQMSIIGLIVAMGLVVDTAIVMVNAVGQQIDADMQPANAIASMIRKYRLPLFSSTMTTILAFMPIILLTGPVGEFVRGIGASVIIALCCSYVLSFTIIPALAGRLLKARYQQTRWWQRGLHLPHLRRRFQRLLYVSIKHAKITAPLALILPLLGLLAKPLLIDQFFPRTDRNQFYIALFLPEQTSIYQTRAVIEKANKIMHQYSAITRVSWFLGTSTPTFYYNKLSGNDGLPSSAEAIIDVKTIADLAKVVDPLQQQFNRELPEAQLIVRALWQGPPYRAPIEVKVIGPSLHTLYQLGEQLRGQLQSLPGVTHTRQSIILGLPKLRINADEDRLAQLNLSLNTITRDMQDLFNGIQAGSLLQGPEEIPVLVRLDDKSRRNLAALDNYYLTEFDTESNYEIGLPFMSFAHYQLVPSSANITHLNGQRVNIVSGFVNNKTLPQVPLDQFKKQLSSGAIKLPFGYHIIYGGEANERSEAIDNLFAKVNVIIVIMVAILVLTFNSFSYMIIIALVGLQSIGLGMLSLFVLGYPFAFNSIISMMGLLGVAINASIIIIANLRHQRRAREGDPAAMSHVIIRYSTRHIIATTLTTILGFLPLLFTPGDLWPPFAAAFIGGMALTTIISFIFVPAAYRLLTRTHRN